MSSEHADDLSIIRDALSDSADIMIYGCDFAAGVEGQLAVAALAEATNADIAASDDLTGAAALGGDWDLEVAQGTIETHAISPSAWAGTLDLTITDVGTGGVGVTGPAIDNLAAAMLGGGVTVNSASYSGGASQAATFASGPGASFGTNILTFGDGVIFSTGTAASVAGPNNQGGYTDNAPGIDGDFDFDTLAGNPTFDASFLEVTFTPDVPSGASAGDIGRMTMEIVFGSDEYNEYVYAGVNDTLAVIVNGVNQAVVPNGLAIGIDTINDAATFNPAFGSPTLDPNPEHTAAGFESANPSLYVNNGTNAFNTQMDGFTITIPVTFDVIVGQQNTIKIGIADTSDPAWDSWMFVKADSAQTVIVAENDSVTTPTNVQYNIDVTANDYDLQGDALTVTHILGQPVSPGDTITLASGVDVTVELDGTLTVEGDGVNTANDAFTYSISDGNGGTSTAFVNVTITAPNAPPVAVDDPQAGSGGGTETAAAADLTGGLSGGVVTVVDPTNTMTVSVVSGPDPLQNDSPFGIGMARNNGAADNTMEVAFASGVSSVDLEFGFFNNDVQPANSDGIEQLANFQVFDTLGNDITALVTFALADNSTQGGLAFEAVSSLNGAPNAIVAEGPTAGNPVGSYGENTNGVLTITSTGPEIGSIQFTHQNLPDTRDGLDQPFGVVLESVSYTNAATGTGPFETDEDTVLSIPAGVGVLGNDSDPDGDTVTVSAVDGSPAGVGAPVTLASGAIVALNADGSFDYDPNGAFESLPAGAVTTDTFDYEITDGNGGFDTATVIVTINGVNDAPDGTDNTFTINEDTGHTFAAADFGFSDVDGDAFGSLIINQPSAGTLTYNGIPVSTQLTIPASDIPLLVFTPAADANGAPYATLGFQVFDDSGAGNDTDPVPNTITFNVAPVNDPPVGIDDTIPVTEDTPVTQNVLGNDTDLDGDPLTIASAAIDWNGDGNPDPLVLGAPTAMVTSTSTAIGVITVNANGDVTFVPASNYTGPIPDLTYTPNDGTVDGTPATVTFGPIIAVNDPPVMNLDPDNDSGTPGDPSDDGADDGGFEVTFTENQPSGVPIVDTDFTVSDPEDDIVEIVVTLTNGQIGDTFDFPSVLPGNVSATVVPVATLTAPGVMTITFTGDASTTAADWDAILSSITLTPSTNDVHNPNAADRNVTIEAFDSGMLSSGPLETVIHVIPVNDPPTLDLDDDNSSGINAGNYQGIFTEGGPPAAISSGVVSTDLDDTNLEGVTITLTNGEIGDILNIGSLPAGISMVGVAPTELTAPGTMTIQLTGSASLSDYQDAIAAITFANSSDDPVGGTREITVVGSDGDASSPTRTAFLTVIPVNDAPIPIDPLGDPTTPADAMPPQTGDDASALSPFDVSPYFNDVDDTVLTYSLDPATTPSWMSIDPATGVITGTPPADGSQGGPNSDGIYPITVIATDPSGLTGQTVVEYTISNPPPVAVDDTFGMIENGAPLFENVFSTNPLTQDSDPDGDTFSVTDVAGDPANVGTATAGSTGGLFTIQPNGSLIFQENGDFEDLALGETRDSTVTYTITDADGATDTATVTVTILGTNDGPVVVTGSETPDQVALDAETIAPIDVTTAFNDVDTTDVLTYSASGLPAGLTIDPVTGIISGTIDPSASQNGNTGTPTSGIFTVTVTATDPHGASVTDTFLFTVSNPAPIATDDAATLTEDDAPISLNVISDDLGNGIDSDPDGDTPLTVSEINGDPALVGTAVPGSSGGTFTVNADGTTSFDPGLDFQYLDDGESATTTVTYQVTDGEGGFDTATLTVTVTGVNDAPIPVVPGDPTGPADPNNYIPDQSGTDGAPLTPFDTSVYFDDPDTSDTLTFSSPDLPSWMSIDPVTGVITGTAPLDASIGGPNSDGVYPITILVTDGDLTFSTTLDYSIANLPPDAVDDAYTLTEDTVLSVPAAGILVNDTDGDGDPITVTQLNGDPLAVGVATTLPSGATVTLNADGSFDYDPTTAFNYLAAGETGTDSFTYQIGDGDGLFDTATVTFTINGVNDAPTAVDDAFAHTENGVPTTGNVLNPNPTTADSDPDVTDVLTISEVNGSAVDVGSPVAGDAGGLFTILPDGSMTFDDNGDFEDLAVGETRDTTVTYTIDDGNGGTDTVTVTGTNDTPIPVDPLDPTGPADPADYIPAQTGVDGTAVTPVDLTPYFGDPDTSDDLTLSVDPADLPDGLTFDPLTGTISGAPGPDASLGGDPLNPGTYVIPVTATDPSGATFTTNLVYTITNQPPVAQDDSLSTDEDTANNGSVFDDNGSGIDTDAPDGDIITVSEVGGDPANVGQPVAGSNGGTFTINPDGTYSFDPGTDFNGLAVGEQATTTIEYQISDGQGGFDTALVTVVVDGVNDNPVIILPPNPGTPENPIPADPLTAIPVQPVTDGEDFTTTPLIDIDDYVQDPDQTDDPLLVYSTTDTLPVGLTLNPDGTVTGVVDPSASTVDNGDGPGIYTVTVLVEDPHGGSATVQLAIDVSNIAPTAVDDASINNEDTVQTGNVLTDPVTGDADTPPDSDPLTVTEVDGVTVAPGTPTTIALTYGSLDMSDDGSWTFTPNGMANQLDVGETATEVVSYTISDGQGGTDTATLTIEITGINDPVQVVDPGDPTTDPEDPTYDPTNPTAIPDPDNLIPDVTWNDGDTITPIPAGNYFGDAEGDTITFSATDLPTGLSIDPVTGEITGTIDPNASQEGNTGTPGEHLVVITATDPFGNTATTTVTITAVNLPVVAQDDALTGDEDTTVSGSVFDDNGNGIDSDTLPDSDPQTVVEINGVPGDVGLPVDGTNGGVFTLNPDGTFTFEPGNDFQYLAVGETATTSVEYTITDGDGSTDTAIVTYTVTGVNDAPIPVDPTQPVVTDPTDPNAPPTDPDDPREPPIDPLDYVPHQPVVDGETVPPLDLTPYFGDPDGTDVVTLSLDPSDLPAGLTFDPLTGTISGTLDNSASQATNVPGGPPGTYVIPVTATDPSGATFTTNITYVVANAAPDAQDDALAIDEDTPLTANVFDDYGSGVDQDTPPDSDVITVSAVNNNPAGVGQPVAGSGGGTFTISPDGSLVFDPGFDFQDLDVGETRTSTVTYEISDGEGGTDIATVTVTVTGANDAPVVIDPLDPGDPNNPNPPDDPLNVIPDQTGSDGEALTPLDVSPYFTDVDGEPLTFGLDPLSTPSWLIIDPVTGVITGTPPSDASVGGPNGDGVYTLTVTAIDPDGATVSTTVGFAISNLPPMAEDDTLTVDEDTALVGDLFADNGAGPDHDTAPDSDLLVVSGVNGTPGDVGQPVAGSNGGTFTINADGSYSFDPGTDFQDLDAGETRDTLVTYTVDDGNGGTDTATVTVTVTGVNDAPVVIDPNNPGTPNEPNPGDPATVLPPQTGTDAIPVSPLDLSPYFADVDGELLTFEATGLPPGLSIDPVTGVITGTPVNDDSVGGPNSDGVYPVTITVADPDGETATLTFNWTIANQPPEVISTPSGQSVLEGGDYLLDTGNLFNDPDDDRLTFSASGLPEGMTIDPVTGVITGTAVPGSFGNAPNGAGAYVVSVTVDDGQGGTTTVTFDLFVEPIRSTDIPVTAGPGIPLPPADLQFGDHDGLSVDDAVAYAGPVGADAGFETDHVIEEVVGYIGDTWTGGETDYHPYAGQNLDVAFGTGNDRMLLRTMIWGGNIFLEMRSGSGLDVNWSVTGLSGARPDWIAMAADNLLRIDIPAGADSFRISVSMELPDGRIVTLPVTIDRVSGEITPLEPAEVTLSEFSTTQERLAWLSRDRSVANARLIQALRG